MKSIFTYTTLLSIVGLTVAVAAEATALAPISSLSFEVPFSLFVISAALMLVKADYSRHGDRMLPASTAKPVLLPANEAFAAAPVQTRRRTRVAFQPSTTWSARHRRIRRQLARR